MQNVPRISCVLVVTIIAALAGGVRAQAAPTSAAPAVGVAAPPSSAKVAEKKLAHRVANALARKPDLNSSHILVKARRGFITLSGSVTDRGQMALAVEAAKQVEGVIGVESRIHISGASL